MFQFIKRFFSHHTHTSAVSDFSASVHELWTTDFSDPENRRFEEEKGDGYEAFFSDGLTLELQRKSLFAWTVDPQYQYTNFVLEAVLDFSEIHTYIPDTVSLHNDRTAPQHAGSCAYGFLFRYINESNYYTFLVSDKGFFRFDAVFNGNQIPLTGWTAIPAAENATDSTEALFKKKLQPGQIPVHLIADGTKFSIVINYQLAAVIEDDTIQSEGYVAFAAQNWNQYEIIRGTLRFFSIDSRELQTDAASQQWNADGAILPAQRIRLAESFASIGKIIPAILELKKAWQQTDATVPDLLLGAQLYMTQNLFAEAAALLEKARQTDSSDIRITEQMASLYYLQGDYRSLDALFEETGTADGGERSSLLCSLKGHVCASLRKYEEAAALYRQAAEIEPAQAQHRINEASMYEMLGQTGNMFDARVQAAEILLAGNRFDDFETQLALLRNPPKDTASAKRRTKQEKHDEALRQAAILFLEAQYASLQDDPEQAAEKIAGYMQTVPPDSVNPDVWYLLSRIQRDAGNIAAATDSCKKAAALNPEKALYRRTLAELLFTAGNTAEAEKEILTACTLDGTDGSAWNLAATLAFQRGDIEAAEKAVFTALAYLPEALPVLKNYALILQKLQRFAEALPVLDEAAAHSGYGIAYRAEALHTAANCLREEHNLQEAEVRYKKALALTPRNPQLIADYAALCITLNRLNEADDMLSRSYTMNPPPDVYRMIACIAAKKGDYPRAEVTLRQALEEDALTADERAGVLIDLANLYLLTNKTEAAEKTVGELSGIEVSPRVAKLLESLEGKTHRKITCAKCGREWRVPQKTPDTGTLRLTAEPPDTLPAGNCPECGNIYCIGCAKETLDESGRFRCLSCGTTLKLQDKGVIWLLSNWNKTRGEHHS